MIWYTSMPHLLIAINYIYAFIQVLHQFHFLWKCLLPFANKRVLFDTFTSRIRCLKSTIKDNCYVLLLNSSNFDEATMTGGSLYLDQLIHNSSNCNIILGIHDDGPIIVRIPLYIEISGWVPVDLMVFKDSSEIKFIWFIRKTNLHTFSPWHLLSVTVHNTVWLNCYFSFIISSQY